MATGAPRWLALEQTLEGEGAILTVTWGKGLAEGTGKAEVPFARTPAQLLPSRRARPSRCQHGLGFYSQLDAKPLEGRGKGVTRS